MTKRRRFQSEDRLQVTGGVTQCLLTLQSSTASSAAGRIPQRRRQTATPQGPECARLGKTTAVAPFQDHRMAVRGSCRGLGSKGGRGIVVFNALPQFFLRLPSLAADYQLSYHWMTIVMSRAHCWLFAVKTVRSSICSCSSSRSLTFFYTCGSLAVLAV